MIEKILNTKVVLITFAIIIFVQYIQDDNLSKIIIKENN